MERIMNKEYLHHVVHAFMVGVKWILFGGLIGVVVGVVASLFAMAIVEVTAYRQANGWLIFLLPFAGLFIVFLYQKTASDRPRDTNRVITAIREREHIPISMAPLIIVSTVVTHLFGGSVGREGAALQVGGSIADYIGRLLHFHTMERRRVIMCGMSAAFSALFGTPLAAAILSMEISTVGIMYYAALVPCMVSALTAHYIAGIMGVSETILTLRSSAVTTDLRTAAVILIFAALCAPVSSLFSTMMHKVRQFMTRRIPNPYLRVVVSGIAVILLTLLVGDQTYNGTGSDIIASCIKDPAFSVASYAFLLKMVFTAITLGGGFQGGEIVPSLFIGAAFGHTFAVLTGGTTSLYSAIGMACVFCGVTNCPIASLLISCEMFGFEGSTLYLLAIAITYLFSGNYGLYSAQHILDSKFDPGRIDSLTH